MWLAKEKFPYFDKITFMDITKDKKYGILGGVVAGEITLVLFTFDTNMLLVSSTSIPSAKEFISSGITGIRASNQSKGVILATTRNELFVLKVEGTAEMQLNILKQVEIGCDMGVFCDMCTLG
jgi:hypothetical protein